MKSALKTQRTRALEKGLLIFLCLLCFATAHRQPRQASPERVGEYRQTRLFYRAPRRSVKRRAIQHLHWRRGWRVGTVTVTVP